MEQKKVTEWEKGDEFGSDILGSGSAWGDMRGKVKTRQIGFIRNESKLSTVASVRKKNKTNTKKCSQIGTKTKR